MIDLNVESQTVKPEEDEIEDICTTVASLSRTESVQTLKMDKLGCIKIMTFGRKKDIKEL